METDQINNFKLFLPQIKSNLQLIKNRRGENIYFINQVPDPSLTLISKKEAVENHEIKKENLVKLKYYLEHCIFLNAKLDFQGNNNNKWSFEELFLFFKNSVEEQLKKIELAFAKINNLFDGPAYKFFKDFSNGALNDPSKFLCEFENLVVALTLKSSSLNLFERAKKFVNCETTKIMKKFEFVSKEIESQQFHIYGNFPNAIVIRHDEFKLVSEWIRQQVGTSKMFEPIFNTKDDGFSFEIFHKKCDNKGATLVFIENSNGKRFGGYANSSWHSKSEYIDDQKCFIFSLDLKEIYLHKSGMKASMRGCYGPCFGAGHDIYVGNNEHQSSCTLNFTYEVKGRSDVEIAGSHKFMIKNYEVYQVIQFDVYLNQLHDNKYFYNLSTKICDKELFNYSLMDYFFLRIMKWIFLVV